MKRYNTLFLFLFFSTNSNVPFAYMMQNMLDQLTGNIGPVLPLTFEVHI